MTAPFTTPESIANRALQRLGATRITSFLDNTKQAQECAACYDALRQAELSRNIWTMACRRAALRPVDTTTLLIQPTAWAATTLYLPGAIVSDSAGNLWTSDTPENINNVPGADGGTVWDPYFGPLTVQPWNQISQALQYGLPAGPPNPTTQIPTFSPSGSDAYFAGELVYVTQGDGKIYVFRSLENDNADNPWASTEWNYAQAYARDQIVVYQWQLYKSLVEVNRGNVPSSSSSQWVAVATQPSAASWQPIACAVTSLRLTYPVGAGPLSQAGSRNVYRLPSGYLRKAPQDPKAGAASFLGFPSNLRETDWEFEDRYLTSVSPSPVLFRFVADITDVTRMSTLFCEGLACRMAIELCETLTQSPSKLAAVTALYRQFMGEARTINAIEQEPVEPPLDDYIATRI